MGGNGRESKGETETEIPTQEEGTQREGRGERGRGWDAHRGERHGGSKRGVGGRLGMGPQPGCVGPEETVCSTAYSVSGFLMYGEAWRPAE